ncbi:MAG: hypothetical protein LUO90_00355 [Methanoregula sp.]|jgi:hypothetical protein|nr:hypothetical protein [Methanoregula sp.]
MDKNIKIFIVLGIIITIAAYFYDIYLAGIVGVIVIALIMTMMIMRDTTGIPEVVAKLNDDAKGIVLTNTGNARAEKIHATLIPDNLDFDIASLEVDSTFVYPLDKMVQEIKINLTYSNENGRLFTSSKKLSVFDEEPDLLRPLIPMFKWKK